MGIREQMNEHSRVAVGVAAAVIGFALVFVISNSDGGTGRQPVRTKGKAWFSDDDGKNWFADQETRIPPIDHNGKPAYRAYVYTCDGGKTKFVAYLTRFTPEGKARLLKAQASGEPIDPGPPGLSPARGLEIKKPGDARWTKASDRRAMQVQIPVCPEGAGQTLAPVFP
jgi:hypothetical protein